MTSHPYRAKHVAYDKAAEEFDYFAINALVTIPQLLQNNPRSVALEEAHSFLVQRTSPISLQAWFGKRPTNRPKIEGGGTDVEIGAQLVYSLGPDGRAVAILYPARSDRAQATEDLLVLGPYWPKYLAGHVDFHLRALVAYCYVTSIDGQPTFAERMIVRWLRLVCIRQVDGTQSVGSRLFRRKLAEFATRGFFTALFRVLLVAVFIFLLIWLGYDGLAGFFARHI